MKKFFLIGSLCLGICCTFTNCGGKDDDDNSGGSPLQVNATVEEGSSYDIDEVRALIAIDEEYDEETGNYIWVGKEIAKGSYTGGKFSLNLPATVEDKYLESIEEYEEYPASISVSDRKAKGTVLAIVGYKSGKQIGDFYNEKYLETETSHSYYDVEYIYVDRNLTITGTETDEDGDTYKYSVNMKKGWNLVYYVRTSDEDSYTRETTTKAQSGLKWFFYGQESYMVSSSAKPMRKSPKLFK